VGRAKRSIDLAVPLPSSIKIGIGRLLNLTIVNRHGRHSLFSPPALHAAINSFSSANGFLFVGVADVLT
jgi:hypothetical protein